MSFIPGDAGIESCGLGKNIRKSFSLNCLNKPVYYEVPLKLASCFVMPHTLPQSKEQNIAQANVQPLPHYQSPCDHDFLYEDDDMVLTLNDDDNFSETKSSTPYQKKNVKKFSDVEWLPSRSDSFACAQAIKVSSPFSPHNRSSHIRVSRAAMIRYSLTHWLQCCHRFLVFFHLCWILVYGVLYKAYFSLKLQFMLLASHEPFQNFSCL